MSKTESEKREGESRMRKKGRDRKREVRQEKEWGRE